MLVQVYLAERLRQVMGERDRLSSALGKSEDQLRSEIHRCKGAEAELQRLLTSREQDIRELKVRKEWRQVLGLWRFAGWQS